MYSNKILYFPLKITLLFLIFTEVLYIVGPIDFDIRNLPLFVLFITLCNASLYFGYRKGIKLGKITTCQIQLGTVKLFFIIALFLKFYELVYIWSGHGIPISFTSVVNAIFDPGKAYYSEAKDIVNGSGLLRLLVAPITWAVIPFGIYFWNRVSFSYKCIFVLSVLIEIFIWLGIGVRKGVFDVIILIPILYIAKNSSLLLDVKQKKKMIFILSVFLLLFLFYFVFSNMSRGGSEDMSTFADMLVHRTPKKMYLDNCPLWLLLSSITIEDYLCQGYDALDKALEIGLITPIPFSSNWFTINILQSYFNINVFQNTYLDILFVKEHIDPTINWHTIYVWLANSYTFLCVPIVIFLIGYFFGQTWKDAVGKQNPFAYPIFTLFFIMVIYSFANNQVMSSSFSPFWFWFIFYHFTKKRIKI